MTIRDIVREILDEESAAAKAAKKAGLVHLGFGRYGPKKGGSATHVSKDGKLKSVGDDSGSGDEKSSYFDDPADLSPSQKAHTAAADAELDRIDKEKQSKDEPEQSAYDKMGPEARELKLTMDSSEEGYKQQYIPILKNLSRKMKKGTYDKEKAVKLMMYYVSNGAKRYEKDFGGGGATGPSVGGFDKKTREEAARAYVEDFEDDWDNKNWDFMESIVKRSKTVKEFGEGKMKLESLLKENPAAAAAAAMATVTLLNKETGRKNKAITALRNKDNPSHGKAVGIFQKLKDKFKKKEDEPVDKVAQYRALMQKTKDDAHYAKQYAARTGNELGEDKMNERVDFHTITGNKRFMTKTALTILRKHGVKNVKVNNVAGDFLEIRFAIDSNKLKKIDKELKRKNKTAYGGIVENRRDKMTEDILRKVIREEIKKMIKEDDSAFDQPIPAQIERYMKKFINAVQGAKLNRRRTTAILGRVVAAMNIEPNDLMRYIRKVKKGL